jgi:hypothetical protein
MAGYSEAWGGPPPRKWAARLLAYPPAEREALIVEHVPEHLRALVRSYLWSAEERERCEKPSRRSSG